MQSCHPVKLTGHAPAQNALAPPPLPPGWIRVVQIQVAEEVTAGERPARRRSRTRSRRRSRPASDKHTHAVCKEQLVRMR